MRAEEVTFDETDVDTAVEDVEEAVETVEEARVETVVLLEAELEVEKLRGER